MNNIYKDVYIPCGHFFWLENDLMLAIGTRDFSQNDIETLATLNDVAGILFYFPTFNTVDFSILKNKKIKKLSFLHGNFNDENLKQLADFTYLESIHLLDTKVTPGAISKFNNQRPLIDIK